MISATSIVALSLSVDRSFRLTPPPRFIAHWARFGSVPLHPPWWSQLYASSGNFPLKTTFNVTAIRPARARFARLASFFREGRAKACFHARTERKKFPFFSVYGEKLRIAQTCPTQPVGFSQTKTAGVNPRPTAAVKPQRVPKERASCAAWHASFLHFSFRFLVLSHWEAVRKIILVCPILQVQEAQPPGRGLGQIASKHPASGFGAE